MNEAEIAEGVTRGVLSTAGKWISNLFKKKSKKEPKLTISYLKEKINILFIDDELFEYLDIIRDVGWNTTQIFDLKSFNDEHLKRAHIIFLDYVGVGKILTPTLQGIGILKEIKRLYPNKIVIFYSGHAGFNLGDEFKKADDWMPKNSDPYVFLQKIEENAQKLRLI